MLPDLCKELHETHLTWVIELGTLGPEHRVFSPSGRRTLVLFRVGPSCQNAKARQASST